MNTHSVISQQYPVQVTSTLIPPYSVYLSDYTAPGSNSLQVMVNLLELDRSSLQIKFRVRIEGAGIILQTSPAFNPRPATIQGGVPELFTGSELSPYFNPDNLEFEGISRSRFQQLGRLPEGFYTITIEVLEYNRNVRVSNQSLANAWIMLNDPPLINTPFNGDKLVATDPQNIMFSWTPRHLASPNAAFTTEYEFRMIELYPGQTNPDVAIRSSNSIYTTTTSLTSLNYGILEPTLIPGKTYAFRIRAYDTSNRDLFKNQGYSETYVFQYGEACNAPEKVNARTLDPQRARITWESSPVHTDFIVDYREVGGDAWFNEETNGSFQIVTGLAGQTTYEYRLTPQCGSFTGNQSEVYTFTTPALDPSTFVCGAPIPEFKGSPFPLMKPLLPLDVIHSGDWSVNVINARANGDGTYAGEGYAAVPNFNLANVRVTFDRILVNSDYQVIAGDIKSVYSTNSRFVLDQRPPEEAPEEIAEEVVEPEAPEVEEDLVADVLAVNIEADISEVAFVNGLLEVMDEEGNIIEEADLDLPPEGEALTITDSNGDTWVVDDQGNVAVGATPVAEPVETEDETLSGLSVDPDMVVIHSITESFKPGTDRAEFTYSIVDTEELPYRKLEIFYVDEEENEELITFYDLEAGEEIEFLDTQDEDQKGWSGKGTDLEYVKAGNYKFKITATRDESFKHGYEEWETVRVPESNLVPTAEILKQTAEATKIGTAYKGNEVDVACNICVRAALYLLKGDKALFPKTGSGFNNPDNNYLLEEFYGYISHPGKAKEIKVDFDNILNNIDLLSRFTEIKKADQEGYAEFFKRIQDRADMGGIVIGTMLTSDGSSGHIMMVTPGGMIEIDDKTNKWGDSFARRDRNILELPRVLECGSGARSYEAPLCRNVDYKGATKRLKWYVYGL